MKTRLFVALTGFAGVSLAAAVGHGQQGEKALVFGDWRSDSPGTAHKITVDDLPKPHATSATAKMSEIVPLAASEHPSAPDGFKVQMLARDFKGPRTMRIAPNGDIFLAESDAGRIRVLRLADDKLIVNEVFAEGLAGPYGVAFYPPGPDPRYVYIGAENQVLRYPYSNGALKPSGKAEKIAALPQGGHSTRDIAFSPDGATLYVAVGSETNAAEGMRAPPPAKADDKQQAGAIGALGGMEKRRAMVLAFDPDGGHERPFATGLRNCSGVAIRPGTDELWCAVNERDMLGDDLPPDYAANVKQGSFYGWPWYYIGAHPDPTHAGERPDLADKVATPEVLIQPHSAPLGIAFYEGGQFPQQYKGDAFAALHGSWNRSKLTGYKIIRLRFDNGKPTGGYEDFITGFVLDNGRVWGRPTGVAVAKDGSLLFSEDANGSIWRASYVGK